LVITVPAPEPAGRPEAFFREIVRARLALPLALMIVHFVISLLALLSLAAIKTVLRLIGSEDEIIPGTSTTVSNLEVVACSVIIAAGAFEALMVLFFGIILDCVRLVRRIGDAWRS
jgi:hypothetical protein